MKERVDGHWLVVPQPVHEAKTVERALEMFSLPQFGEERFGLLAQIPLRSGVPHILDHASMQHRWVIVG